MSGTTAFMSISKIVSIFMILHGTPSVSPMGSMTNLVIFGRWELHCTCAQQVDSPSWRHFVSVVVLSDSRQSWVLGVVLLHQEHGDVPAPAVVLAGLP